MKRGAGVGPSACRRLLRNLYLRRVVVGVWELIYYFYLLPRKIGLFVKGDVDGVNATFYAEGYWCIVLHL